mgnify:CR=1 FL=1
MLIKKSICVLIVFVTSILFYVFNMQMTAENQTKKIDLSYLKDITKKLKWGQSIYKYYFAKGKKISNERYFIPDKAIKESFMWFKRVVHSSLTKKMEISDLYAKRIQLPEIYYKKVDGVPKKFTRDKMTPKDIIIYHDKSQEHELILLDTFYSINIILRTKEINILDTLEDTVKKTLRENTNIPEKILERDIKKHQMNFCKLEGKKDVLEFRMVNEIDKDNNPETSDKTRFFWYCYVGGFVKEGTAVIYVQRQAPDTDMPPRGKKRPLFKRKE